MRYLVLALVLLSGCNAHRGAGTISVGAAAIIDAVIIAAVLAGEPEPRPPLCDGKDDPGPARTCPEQVPK